MFCLNCIKLTRNFVKYNKCLKTYTLPVHVNKFKHRFSTMVDYDFDIKVNNTSLNNYIISLRQEYQDMCKGNVPKSDRWVDLQPVMKVLETRDELVKNMESIEELLKENDTDLQKLAEEEKQQCMDKIKDLNDKILISLFPEEKEDSFESIVLEVKAGVGGKEAMLFAHEMFEMYCNFSTYKGWEFELADLEQSDLGGIRHAALLINGKSVYQYFKHEAGVHRVQRTPATEKAGRVHTSTVSVVALPQPSEIEINIQQKDLKIETKRSAGAGGQHVNTTDSCVRITHLPTGVAVECQVDRSQIKNRKIAMAKLHALLYDKEVESQKADTLVTRRTQVRSNFRNEKIRTYNFNQDRITDHRLQGNIHNLKGFLLGGEPLEHLIGKLDYQYKLGSLLNIVNNINNK